MADQCPHFEHLLIVPRLRAQNANAISSPLTHGFPAMSAFFGLMWALERKTAAQGMDLLFKAVGVVCHDYQEQVTEDRFVKAFYLTRNPIDKDGDTAAIVEEGRIHLDLSLVFAVQSRMLSEHMALGRTEATSAIAAKVREQVLSMRIAGGSVVSLPGAPAQKADIVALTGTEADQQKAFNRAKLRLLPGFALVSRDDLLETRHAEMRAQDPNTSRLDAWLSLSRINWRCVTPPDKKPEWKRDNPGGWLRPIPVGYGALSGPHTPGAVANARDAKTSFCFAESLYSIGEWIGPHRLSSPQDLLWYADHAPDTGLYRCRNDYRPMPVDDDDDFDPD
jgi:CRISPR-associated protein Csy2